MLFLLAFMVAKCEVRNFCRQAGKKEGEKTTQAVKKSLPRAGQGVL
jgi:hypothetical protein